MCRGELSAVIARLTSKCLGSGLKWWKGVKEISPPFPCCPVNREYLWKKTQIEKKSTGYWLAILRNGYNLFPILNKSPHSALGTNMLNTPGSFHFWLDFPLLIVSFYSFGVSNVTSTLSPLHFWCIWSLKDTINPLELFVEKRQFFNQNYQ